MQDSHVHRVPFGNTGSLALARLMSLNRPSDAESMFKSCDKKSFN